MLRTLKNLESCTIGATDGHIGSVKDVYFDDQQWVVRYLVVSTGTWLLHRKVLLSPLSIRDWGWEGDVIPSTLTQAQVKESPGVDTDKPVSQEYERSFYGYYGYPYYWGGDSLWGEVPYPSMMTLGRAYETSEAATDRSKREIKDRHLRSCNAVSGYRLHASDGEIGHVNGYLVDERSWAIRFLIVDTSNWWLGHQVLVASEWTDRVSWSESTVTTSLTRQTVKRSPTYDSKALLDASGEAALYKHYGRTVYAATRMKAA